MNKVYKTILGATATAIVAGASIVPVNVLAWGDSSNGRQTYTREQINAGELGNTITLNSITDSKIGDERYFVAATTTPSASVWNASTLNVKDGDVVTVRFYVHNNSPLGMNGIAQGVTAEISLPTTVAKEQTIIGYLNASNATPSRIWDEVTLVADENIYIEFVENSAKFTNTQGTFSLPNEIIVSGGAKLGYTSMNGELPGCYDYDGEVTFQVKVHSSITTKLTTKVRKAGSTDKFGEVVEGAKVGDLVEYQIEYRNISAADVDNVMIRDVLPTNVEYVQDSTYLYNSNHQDGVKINENTLTTTGINIGNYAPNGLAYVRFTGKVVNKNLACGDTQTVNWASATVNGEVFKDDASVIVNVAENCEKNDGKKTDGKNTDGETPKTIVSTGPAEVAGAALGLGSIVTAGGYFIASKRKF